MAKKPANRVLSYVKSQQWLINDEYLQAIIEIAARENDFDAFLTNKELLNELNDPACLLTSHEGLVRGTANTIKRDNWAVIPVMGPIFPRANMFTQISGGASVEMMARDTQIAIDQGLDPVLYISSPGGAVEGVSEFGQMLAGTNAIAYVAGNCTSAAYWLASQCQSIVVSDTAVVGNIGVKAQKPIGRSDSIVSDNAPNKEATPKMVKGIVNDIETVFLAAVASGRNTTVDDVKENFGKGGVFVGEKAVHARLADGVSTLEATLKLSANQVAKNYGKPEMAITQAEKDAHAAEVAALQAKLDNAQAEARAASEKADAKAISERERISAIIASAPDKPIAAMTMAMKTDLSVEAATAALKDMPVEKKESTNDPLNAAMSGTNPIISDDQDPVDDDPQSAIDASWDKLTGAAA